MYIAFKLNASLVLLFFFEWKRVMSACGDEAIVIVIDGWWCGSDSGR